jgi:predicted transcriptional regulator/transcriptional regulator with XRE-family HTH domain
MAEIERKLFLGGRLKRLRRDLGLTQTRMAEDIGLSPSYLNHLERNQRPFTAGLLLRLAQTYDLDLRSFTSDAEAGGEADLNEVFADPLFRDLGIPRHEIGDLAENAPGASEAIVRLYRAFLDGRRRQALDPAQADADDGEGPSPIASPTDWVRDYVQAQRNHFPELDALGEQTAEELQAIGWSFEAAAAARLQERFKIRVQVMPVEVMVDYLRRYDIHRRRLLLSEVLGAASRAFATASQLAQAEHGEVLNQMAEAAGAPDLPTRRLLKVSLTNYLAAAIQAPYSAFHAAVESLGYDIGLLQARFGMSFEQVAHRLTTLSRPGARGVPFFLIRIDQAGNVSKRFAAGAFPFSRFGGSCPRWRVHSVFRNPGVVTTQIVETRDGARYFTLSRTVERPAAGWKASEDAGLAIGLGCELKQASKLVYAAGIDLANPAVTEIGPTCRLCERPNCRERAAPPVTRTLTVEDWSRSVSPYPFASHG